MMHRTLDPTLGPIKAWAAVVRWIRSYHGMSPDTPVNTVCLKSGKIIAITSKMLLDCIRAAVSFLGEAKLGYSQGNVGTHSIRSGAAMAMYLAGVPVFMIMLIGCWSSDAFLQYIHRQVQEFSMGCPLACYFLMTSSPSRTSHHTRTPAPMDTPTTSLHVPILAPTPSAGLQPQHLPCTTRTKAFKCGFALGLWILDPDSAGAQVSSWKLEVQSLPIT